MEVSDSLYRELGVERDRWDCPNYYAIIFTSEDNWGYVLDYVDTWNHVTVDETGKRLRLSEGGIIQFYNLENKTSEDMKRDMAGIGITTSIIDTSVVEKVGCQMRDVPLYLISCMRGSCKYGSKIVII